MREIHIVFGGLAAKNFILPISKSSINESLIFYQMSNKNDILKIEGVKSFPYWFNLKISPKLNIFTLIKSLIYLSRLLKKYDNYKLITHMTSYSLFPLLVAFFLRIKNRVYFNHGFAHIGSKGIIKIILFILEFLNCLMATNIITVSPSHLEFIKKGLIANKRNIKTTLPGSCSGIDLSKLISKDDLKKKCLSISNSDNIIYLSYIGRPYFRKGFPFILEIFENIKKEMPSRKIILQVIGIKKEKIFEELNNKKYFNSIETIEQTNDVFFYLRKSVITILPSIREGFGYALLEGATSGNALITFNMLGPDSLVKNNHNGLLIKYGSKPNVFANEICKLISKPEKLKFLMNNSRQSAKEFDKDIVLKSLREIL